MRSNHTHRNWQERINAFNSYSTTEFMDRFSHVTFYLRTRIRHCDYFCPYRDLNLHNNNTIDCDFIIHVINTKFC